MASEKPGFFSKVAQLVRGESSAGHPSSEAPTESSVIDSGEEAASPKETLKRMLERKRHDDAVRAREFDRLRKLRASAARGADAKPGGPSGFLDTSNFTDLSERAETLRKIDEIEAQMSRQWWRGRPLRSGQVPLEGGSRTSLQADDSETRVPHITPSQRGDLGPATVFEPRESVAPPPDPALISSLNLDGLLPPGPAETSSTLMQARGDSDWMSTDVMASRQSVQYSTGFASDSPSAFSSSKISAAESGADWSCPELDEAALQFANGNDVGAEAALKQALAEVDDRSAQATLLSGALFDLFRATGQLPAFDQFAMDYVLRFGRSAPAWANWAKQAAEQAHDQPQAPAPVQVWTCPPTVNEAAVASLLQFLREAAQPWAMDWRALRLIELGAAMPLYQVMDKLAQSSVKLRFDEGETLNRWLKGRTPSQRADVPQSWWFLKLAALRVQGLVDEFELAALDYCVTYEVSPPAWQPPVCQMVGAVEGGAMAAVAGTSQAVLLGQLSGEIDAALKATEAFISAQGVLQVDCTRLLRIDFFAAGGLLNWAAALHANGVRVELQHVSRLVGAFLQVIGIGGSARLRLRDD